MAPVTRPKKNRVTTNSEQVLSSKKRKKNRETADVAVESISEVVVSDKKTVEDDCGDAKECVPTPKVKKPCTWLKLDRLNSQIGSKSSHQSSKQGKEANSQVQAIEEGKRKRTQKFEERGNGFLDRDEKNTNSRVEKEEERMFNGQQEDSKMEDPDEKKMNSRHEKREKGTANDRHDDTLKKDKKSGNRIGGLIFMCNARTKPDCFGYRLMGVPVNKKEVVVNIKPGLILFLYDYDLKLLYGVYEASSAGGMKLEPAAFGGGFPAQVRFTVHKDCLPLPESMFRTAMKGNYDERTRKFNTELTVKQVKRLIDSFQPRPWLRPNGKSVVPEGDTIIHPVPAPILAEQEYRSYNLRQGPHILPMAAVNDVSHTHEPYKLDQELKQLLRDPASSSMSSVVQQEDVNRPSPVFLSERDYRTYGLRGPHQILTAAPPRMSGSNPYGESTDSVVNRYLAMSTAIPAVTYPPAQRIPYMNDLNHTTEARGTVPGGERAYFLHEQSDLNKTPYSSREPSVFSQGVCLQSETDLISAPVSNRYSFGGSLPQQG